MIKTSQNQSDIAQLFAADFVTDKQPLIDYAGFESGSEFAGTPRQTFTIALSTATIANIKSSIAVLYEQLLAACWPKNAILPFDMVRFDAFLDPSDDSLKIIELNTRNVGLHEIVEWLDDNTATQISAEQTPSLNDLFVGNQKKMHSTLFGDDAPLLYMSKPMIPRWKYYDALVAAYSSVCPITSPEEYQAAPDGLMVNGVVYAAITRKYCWPVNEATIALDDSGTIRILQPRRMRYFGHKDYLPQFKSSAILHSDVFNIDDINDYVARKNDLVLKIINSGGSFSVYLGPLCSDQQWRHYLLIAAQQPKLWVVQDYTRPPYYEVMAHGLGAQQARVQLGIFVLPNADQPTEFIIDIVAKAYTGSEDHFTFDPSGLHPEIWFGNIVELITASPTE